MTKEQITEIRLKQFEKIPDVMLRKDTTGDDAIFSSLQRAMGAESVEGTADAGITDSGSNAPESAPNTANPGEQFQQIPNPVDKSTIAGMEQAVKPSKLVSYKLKELIEPELVIMIMDMLLSWGGSELLQANGMDVQSEDIQADEFQVEILKKAFNPLFESFEVGTNNPAVAISLAMVAVYGKNIMVAIKVHKSELKAQKEKVIFEKPLRPKPKYNKPKRQSVPRKKKPDNLNNQNN
jgi:hypothetical protein